MAGPDTEEDWDDEQDTLIPSDPTGRPPQLAVVFSLTSWHWTGDLVWGALLACRASGYEALLVHFDRSTPEVESQRLWSLCDHGSAEGVVIIPPSADSDFVKEGLNQRRIPFSLVEPQTPGRDQLTVGVDNEGGSAAAVRHLLELGHRRIGYVLGAPDVPSSEERYLGYVSTLRKAGVTIHEDLIVHGTFHPNSGDKAAPYLLGHPNPPTAIMCANDEMAASVLHKAHELGRRVPEDVSVVGFDDSLTATTVTPRLTTVRQPRTELGRTATQLVIDALAGERRRHNLVLPAEVRYSVIKDDGRSVVSLEVGEHMENLFKMSFPRVCHVA